MIFHSRSGKRARYSAVAKAGESPASLSGVVPGRIVSSSVTFAPSGCGPGRSRRRSGRIPGPRRRGRASRRCTRRAAPGSAPMRGRPARRSLPGGRGRGSGPALTGRTGRRLAVPSPSAPGSSTQRRPRSPGRRRRRRRLARRNRPPAGRSRTCARSSWTAHAPDSPPRARPAGPASPTAPRFARRSRRGHRPRSLGRSRSARRARSAAERAAPRVHAGQRATRLPAAHRRPDGVDDHSCPHNASNYYHEFATDPTEVHAGTAVAATAHRPQ